MGVSGFMIVHDRARAYLLKLDKTYPIGAPDEQDGLSPITLSYSRNVTLEKVTFRGAAEIRVFTVDLLPPLDPPALLWSVRM